MTFPALAHFSIRPDRISDEADFAAPKTPADFVDAAFHEISAKTGFDKVLPTRVRELLIQWFDGMVDPDTRRLDLQRCATTSELALLIPIKDILLSFVETHCRMGVAEVLLPELFSSTNDSPGLAAVLKALGVPVGIPPPKASALAFNFSGLGETPIKLNLNAPAEQALSITVDCPEALVLARDSTFNVPHTWTKCENGQHKCGIQPGIAPPVMLTDAIRSKELTDSSPESKYMPAREHKHAGPPDRVPSEAPSLAPPVNRKLTFDDQSHPHAFTSPSGQANAVTPADVQEIRRDANVAKPTRREQLEKCWLLGARASGKLDLRSCADWGDLLALREFFVAHRAELQKGAKEVVLPEWCSDVRPIAAALRDIGKPVVITSPREGGEQEIHATGLGKLQVRIVQDAPRGTRLTILVDRETDLRLAGVNSGAKSSRDEFGRDRIVVPGMRTRGMPQSGDLESHGRQLNAAMAQITGGTGLNHNKAWPLLRAMFVQTVASAYSGPRDHHNVGLVVNLRKFTAREIAESGINRPEVAKLFREYAEKLTGHEINGVRCPPPAEGGTDGRPTDAIVHLLPKGGTQKFAEFRPPFGTVLDTGTAGFRAVLDTRNVGSHVRVQLRGCRDFGLPCVVAVAEGSKVVADGPFPDGIEAVVVQGKDNEPAGISFAISENDRFPNGLLWVEGESQKEPADPGPLVGLDGDDQPPDLTPAVKQKSESMARQPEYREDRDINFRWNKVLKSRPQGDNLRSYAEFAQLVAAYMNPPSGDTDRKEQFKDLRKWWIEKPSPDRDGWRELQSNWGQDSYERGRELVTKLFEELGWTLQTISHEDRAKPPDHLIFKTEDVAGDRASGKLDRPRADSKEVVGAFNHAAADRLQRAIAAAEKISDPLDFLPQPPPETQPESPVRPVSSAAEPAASATVQKIRELAVRLGLPELSAEEVNREWSRLRKLPLGENFRDSPVASRIVEWSGAFMETARSPLHKAEPLQDRFANISKKVKKVSGELPPGVPGAFDQLVDLWKESRGKQKPGQRDSAAERELERLGRRLVVDLFGHMTSQTARSSELAVDDQGADEEDGWGSVHGTFANNSGVAGGVLAKIEPISDAKSVEVAADRDASLTSYHSDAQAFKKALKQHLRSNPADFAGAVQGTLAKEARLGATDWRDRGFGARTQALKPVLESEKEGLSARLKTHIDDWLKEETIPTEAESNIFSLVAWDRAYRAVSTLAPADRPKLEVPRPPWFETSVRQDAPVLAKVQLRRSWTELNESNAPLPVLERFKDFRHWAGIPAETPQATLFEFYRGVQQTIIPSEDQNHTLTDPESRQEMQRIREHVAAQLGAGPSEFDIAAATRYLWRALELQLNLPRSEKMASAAKDASDSPARAPDVAEFAVLSYGDGALRWRENAWPTIARALEKHAEEHDVFDIGGSGIGVANIHSRFLDFLHAWRPLREGDPDRARKVEDILREFRSRAGEKLGAAILEQSQLSAADKEKLLAMLHQWLAHEVSVTDLRPFSKVPRVPEPRWNDPPSAQPSV